jgi:Kef-type K+ transport system membrane component KefB
VAGFGAGRGLRASVVGWGMVPRGEVGLIFVATGAQLRLNGVPLLSPELQAGIIGALLLTTVAGPVGLGRVLRSGQ